MKSFKNVVANQASFAELRQKENVRYEEKSLETADGRRIDVEFDSHVYLVDHYRVVQCRIRDVTERMRAEERIREQAALLDNANDAIYVMALDFTILFWNRGAERTYGWTSAEALNRKTAELLAVDLAAAEALIAVLFKQESWSGERWQMTKDGRKVEVFSRLTLVRDKQGQPQSVFAINTDITEKRQLEAQFLRAQRLESIGALASGIAHDLNNVLAPILMGAPLLREMSKDETSRHLLKTMESSALRGAAIVKQVLTFARGVEGERVALQPRHLLREMEGIAEETFPKSIRIESDVASDLWPVLGDSTQLHQVLMNLCVNARDAMPGGGVLTLNAANIVLTKETAGKIPGAQPGSYVCLRVIDTGTGIPPEIEAKIFEPFFTTKGVGKGTGLGLSTVVGIVRSHGGFVRVASKVGQGSAFELYLPATPTEQVVVKKDSASPWAHAHAYGEGILVVDDEAAVREVVRQTLEAFGYQVITAGHGGEALRIFKERRQEIQLVLTDMMMPEMDGPTLVAALRVLNPAVRIVGITGMGDPAGLSGMKTLALSATLAKPFTIKEILAAVREALPVTAGHEGSAPAGGGSRPATPG
jgi:PAS domain S-box-containing protein